MPAKGFYLLSFAAGRANDLVIVTESVAHPGWFGPTRRLQQLYCEACANNTKSRLVRLDSRHTEDIKTSLDPVFAGDPTGGRF